MKIKKLTAILTLVMVVFTAGPGLAQQPEPTISGLRAEIQKRQAFDVPTDMVEMNRARLNELRASLRKLLEVEVQKLVKYRNELTLTPDERKLVEAKLQEYQSELDPRLISSLRTTFDSGPGSGSKPISDSGTTSGTGSAPVRPPNPPQNDTTAPPPAVPPLSASTNTNKQTTQRTCAEQNALSKEQQNAKVISQVDYKLCDLVSVIKTRPGKDIKLTGVQPNGIGNPDYFDLLVILIAKKSTPKFLVEAEEARTDKQVSSAPSSSGSTSLVVKGGAPAVLGFAVENGALTQAVNGTTVTFRGNPMGLFHALNNDGFISSAITDENDALSRFLRKTSFAFSFDTSRGTQPGVFVADTKQLSSVSARIEFVNKRRAVLYTKEWNDFLSKQAQQFTDTIALTEPSLITTNITSRPLGWRDPALQTWFAETQAAVSAAALDDVESVLRTQLNRMPVAELSPETVALLNGIEEKIGAYLSGRDEILDKIAKGTLVTFEYTNKREVNAPDTSNFRFIAEKGTGGRVDFTFNGSLTIFNNMTSVRNFVKLNPTLPPARRVRDFQFAGQVDVPLGSVRDFGQFVFFAGGRYERLLENASTPLGDVLPNTKGDIGVLQLGLKVPIKGTGMKIPFSVTFANRTELIKEREIRGNFGFTLDLDTFFAKFKPF